MSTTGPKLTDRECEELYQKAHTAGHAAATAIVPPKMVVYSEKRMFDASGAPEFYDDGKGGLLIGGGDNIDTKQPIYVEPEGVCGFAWINVKPGNGSFASWLKRTGKGRADGYYKGVSVWVHDYGQSYHRKAAYAQAFASVIEEAGITAYAMDRLD